MKTISCENAVSVSDTKAINSCELKGERPSWIPRGVWVMGHKHIDLGGTDCSFTGCDGQKWRVHVN